MKSNFSPVTVFHMDNLDALRGMNSETFDCDRSVVQHGPQPQGH